MASCGSRRQGIIEIQISPGVEDEVSPQLLEFVKEVIGKESLSHWDVDIWACRREGLCNDDDLVICLGLCETEMKTKLLFLHEVAHALRCFIDWDDSYWHRDGWGKEYSRLCREHLGMVGDEYEKWDKLFV